MTTKPRSDSSSSTNSTSSTDPYSNANSLFRNSPSYKGDQLDDLSHGTTAKARRWSGAKKNLGEGRSHFEARLEHSGTSDQTKLSREELKVTVKKNKDLPTRVKKNHKPEQASKVVEALQRE